MKCAFDICIYNRKWRCMLGHPDINHMGMCDSCNIVSLDDTFLAAEKERQFLELEAAGMIKAARKSLR